MKILIVATSRFELDGITNVILNYYREMDKAGMQIDFVAPNEVNPELKQEIAQNGGTVYRLTGRLKKPVAYMNELTRLIKTNKYEIVHAHGNSATLYLEMHAAQKGGAPVRIPHSHSTSCRHKLADKLLRPLFYRSYTHAFACGEAAGRWLYGSRPFRVINNGIDIDRYAYKPDVRKEYRDKLGLQDKKVIGHVGRFNNEKNHEFLIDIFAKLYGRDTSYRLMLVGDGRLRADIEAKVRSLGLAEAVMFMGETNEVPQLLQAMDVFVLPSRYEGFSLALIEAQAACLPCIVSDTVTKNIAITDLVTFVSLNDQPEKWADIIMRVSPGDRYEKRNENISKIINSGFSIKNLAQGLKELYSAMLNEASK